MNKKTLQKGDSFTKKAMRKFAANPMAMIGLVLLVFFVLASVLAPVLTPYDPLESNYNEAGVMRTFEAPSRDHLLGTDAQGRDVLTRVLYGGRISFSVGLVSVTISLVVGVLLGAISGFFGGWVDTIIMRFVDVVICFPVMFLIITIAAFMDTNVYTIMLIIGLVAWTGYARLVRGEILRIKELEYVQAARVLGVRQFAIILRHVLPNIVAPIIVQATLGVASAILSEASLSYLGVGVMPPTASWGNMINAATNITTLLGRPWIWIPPGLAILLTVVSVNLVGDGLRDAFDAKDMR